MEISVSLDPAVGNNLQEYLSEMNFVLSGINEGRLSFHCDVMDGALVERQAISLEEYGMIMRESVLPVDVHLMIRRVPERIRDYLVDSVGRFGRTLRSVSFHLEAVSAFDAMNIIRTIQKAGVKAGVAIDLDTYVGRSEYRKVIERADVMVIMCVKAGKSGQSFSMGGLQKIAAARKINPGIRIILDGGINVGNVEIVKRAGVDTAVVGSAIYNAEDKGMMALALVRAAKTV